MASAKWESIYYTCEQKKSFLFVKGKRYKHANRKCQKKGLGLAQCLACVRPQD